MVAKEKKKLTMKKNTTIIYTVLVVSILIHNLLMRVWNCQSLILPNLSNQP
jgi:hypothetical protein